MKKLSAFITSKPGFDPEVADLKFDSRLVKKGDLFFAVPGILEDGNKYLKDAFARGAVAAVVKKGSQVPAEFADRCVEHEDIRLAMPQAALKFFDHPGRKLKMFGVTGTKGKTSTSYLLESIFKAAGRRTAIMGTVECRHPGKSYPTLFTTREAIDVQRFLAEAVKEGVDTVVMEVSSHALSLHRVWGLEYDGVLFTNLSPDHMDFYKTMDPYYSAKKMLFEPPYRKPTAITVANADDEYGRRLMKEVDATWLSYGRQGDYRIVDAKVKEQGAWIRYQSPKHGTFELQSQTPGEFTFHNVAAAATVALGAGCTVEQVQKGVSQLAGVPGRLERVATTLPFSVFVDFAHSGHALANVLQALRPVTRNRLIVLFGAGGDKDPLRRTTQGKVAADLADYAIITSDNPRSEDPLKIIEAIVTAHKAAGAKDFVVEPDRRKAIRILVEMAEDGDVLCLAGKGHETGQIVGQEIFPFDDREEAGLVLRERERAKS